MFRIKCGRLCFGNCSNQSKFSRFSNYIEKLNQRNRDHFRSILQTLKILFNWPLTKWITVNNSYQKFVHPRSLVQMNGKPKNIYIALRSAQPTTHFRPKQTPRTQQNSNFLRKVDYQRQRLSQEKGFGFGRVKHYPNFLKSDPTNKSVIFLKKGMLWANTTLY